MWSDWYKHNGSGLPAGLYGKTVEVRATKPFTGTAPDGLSALGIAGVTLNKSWSWTEESRMLPLGHGHWSDTLPIDEYRIFLGAAERLNAKLETADAED